MGRLSKPVPGPWRVGAPSVTNGVQIFHDFDGLRSGSDVICTMPERGKGRTANARLIAAAPDLYQAAKEAIYELDGIAEYTRDQFREIIESIDGVGG